MLLCLLTFIELTILGQLRDGFLTLSLILFLALHFSLTDLFLFWLGNLEQVLVFLVFMFADVLLLLGHDVLLRLRLKVTLFFLTTFFDSLLVVYYFDLVDLESLSQL